MKQLEISVTYTHQFLCKDSREEKKHKAKNIIEIEKRERERKKERKIRISLTRILNALSVANGKYKKKNFRR